jgi:hypothetical protein
MTSAVPATKLDPLLSKLQQAIDVVARRYSWFELTNESEPCPLGWHLALLTQDPGIVVLLSKTFGGSPEDDFKWTYRRRGPDKHPLKMVGRQQHEVLITDMYFHFPLGIHYMKRDQNGGNTSLLHPSINASHPQYASHMSPTIGVGQSPSISYAGTRPWTPSQAQASDNLPNEEDGQSRRSRSFWGSRPWSFLTGSSRAG